MRLALSRIAWATPFHLDSWSGVILSAVLSVAMRCSTVSGLLLVAASAAGGFWPTGLCAVAGLSEPASNAAPVSDAMASERATGLNRVKYVMRCSSLERDSRINLALFTEARGPRLKERRGQTEICTKRANGLIEPTAI